MEVNQQKKLLRRLAIIALVLFVPVFIVGLFARPSADDFGYSFAVYKVVQQGGGVLDVLRAALENDIYYYNNWQGLYSSGFVLSITPSVFGDRFYALTPVLVLGILFLCLWVLLHIVFHRIFPDRWGGAAMTVALLLCFVFAQGMPNQVEGLYWYNGAMNYIPYFSLTLLNMGLAIKLRAAQGTGKQIWFAVLSGLICFIISGGHQVTALLNLLLLFLIVLYGVRKRWFWPVVPFACGIVGLVLNLTSPGTAIRQSGFSGESIPVAAVKSLVLAAFSLLRWLDVPLLCVLALATPLCLHILHSEWGKKQSFRYFWLAPAVITFVLVWAMIFLPSYTMGGIGPGRLINVVWMTFVLGSIPSWLCLLGFIEDRIGHELTLPSWLNNLKTATCTGAVLLLCIACIGGHTVKEGLDNHFATTLEAVYELGNGTPQAFASALDERTAQLEDPAVPNVTITPLTEEQRPYLLYFSDVSQATGPRSIDAYYGKTVEIAPTE